MLMECFYRARLAKIKQDQARSISKRAKPLGRKLRKLPGLMQEEADWDVLRS